MFEIYTLIFVSLTAVLAKFGDKININACVGAKYDFDSKKYWSIIANAHCNDEVTAFSVHQQNGAYEELWEGVYEPYGIYNI